MASKQRPKRNTNRPKPPRKTAEETAAEIERENEPAMDRRPSGEFVKPGESVGGPPVREEE